MKEHIVTYVVRRPVAGFQSTATIVRRETGNEVHNEPTGHVTLKLSGPTFDYEKMLPGEGEVLKLEVPPNTLKFCEIPEDLEAGSELVEAEITLKLKFVKRPT